MRFKAPVEQTTFKSKYSFAGKHSEARSRERAPPKSNEMI